MKNGRTAMATASPPASVLEVIGHDVGHVVITRAAAAVIAPAGSPILPALVALIAAHKASNRPRTEHRYRDAVLWVVQATSALVVGRQGEHFGAAA
jgi:hypothetical protein